MTIPETPSSERNEFLRPTVRDRLRGCQLSGGPSQERSFTGRHMPPEESACLGDATDASSGKADR